MGPVPWLPGSLGWAIVEPVPAERLAALRIGAGLVLLADVCLTFLPFARTLVGPTGYTPFAGSGADPLPGAQWSVCRLLPPEWGGYAVLAALAAAAICLIVGWKPRVAALVAWVCVVSLFWGNPLVHNGGDRIRTFIPMLLIFCPSAAVWAVGVRVAGRVYVSGWPCRLALVQLCCIYGFTAWYKLFDSCWQNGTALAYSCRNIEWCNAPGLLGATPDALLRLGTWFAVAWEMSFPVLAVLPRARMITLAIGVVFHLMTFAMFEVGMFPFFTLCCYLPLFPWEKIRRRAVEPASKGDVETADASDSRRAMTGSTA
ncbi:hypothetical protein FRUB_00511 [Fimbriiglobus ruber]|uniref:HTTM-like domain-containing protein n=1 Tax=Fimbriiglobus ruber TaxID=1908690 RepID=A0A225DZV2_9BACT|nr:hypothetical protein FRUB_00511 [Fimbriiglobus ruber]